MIKQNHTGPSLLDSPNGTKRAPPSGPRLPMEDCSPTCQSRKNAHDEKFVLNTPDNADRPSSEEVEPEEVSTTVWVHKFLRFLEDNGQDLLLSICTRYKIAFDRTIDSIPSGMLEQVAYNAIFNPALPKSPDGLPMMLRDVPGVSDFQMTFLKDAVGVYKMLHVSARLGGLPFSLECRTCSYCGSCFSGRFMDLDSTHQRAGGWKEITDKIHAGKFSWKSLKGWRLCVPCFTNYGQKGTMDNANRLSIKQVIKCNPSIVKEGFLHGCHATSCAPAHINSSNHASSKRRLEKSDFAQKQTTKRLRGSEKINDFKETNESGEAIEVFADGDWWDAHVMETSQDHILVHYVGGTTDEDEWIPKGSDRIRSYKGSQLLTPRTPANCCTPQVAPMKDREISLPPCGALSEDGSCSLQYRSSPAGPPNSSPLHFSSASEEVNSSSGSSEDFLSSYIEDEDGWKTARLVPTSMEVEEKPMLYGAESTVELRIMSFGSDLNFQWYEGSEAIPGACGDKLVLVNAGEVGGRITCCVSNRHGSSWAACPILLPASPQHAKEVLDSIDNPKRYRLECRCGIVTEGSAAMLCQNSCACGAVCCGKIKCLDLPEGCLI
mmetsp:Transcript_10784/g.24517  ORF Transcript_10784/g.24517 Transcript_10784/m.24517 type:complete len:605 (-) Transcript_10784:293-2107(-)